MAIKSKIENRWLWIYNRFYDYYYLVSEINRAYRLNPEILYAGSSYATFGINANEKACNFALPSQDLYYSVLVLKKVISNCNNVKKVVLGFGYYSMNCDLSKTKRKSEIERVYDVYYPLFGDVHNLKREDLLKRKRTEDIVSKILILINKRIIFTKKRTKNMAYFVDNFHSRETRKLCTWADCNRRWNELTNDERLSAAKNRTDAHLKLFKYIDTYKENIELLRKFKQYCDNTGIELYIFISPMSQSYISTMTQQFYQEAERQIKQYTTIVNEGKFVDCNKVSKLKFDDSCFVDADHLSDCGAYILTNFINKEFLK